MSIQEWYYKYKDHIIGVYNYGSRANPYIENPEDYDYLVFTKDTKDFLFISEKALEFESQTEGVHIIVKSLTEFDKKPHKCGDYIYYYIRKIYGDDVDCFYNILYEDEAYFQVLRTLSQDFSYLDPTDPSKTHKRWYHVIMGLYILNRFSYDLSEEEIKIINLAHQGRCPREVYDWCIKKLGIQTREERTAREERLKQATARKFIIRGGKKVAIK